MDLECCLDLLWSKVDTCAVLARHSEALLLFSIWIAEYFWITAQFPCLLRVLLDLLLGIPEPFIDLVLLQVQLLRQLGDLLP